MNDMNPQNSGRTPGSFSADIASDLSSGRAVDLAEVYALHALDDAERTAVDRYLAEAPPAERAEFEERVRQARETLAMSFSAEEEPPAGLFDRIVAALPAQAAEPDAEAQPVPRRSPGGGPSGPRTPGTSGHGRTRCRPPAPG